MTGMEWQRTASSNEQARCQIPLQLTATMPIPTLDGKLACWHYFAQPAEQANSIAYQPPCLITLWDKDGKLLEMKWLQEAEEQLLPAEPFLETGKAERVYLTGSLTDWLSGTEADPNAIRAAWLNTLPAPVAADVNVQIDL